MRFLFFLAACILSATMVAQTTVVLRIDHKAGQAEFDGTDGWVIPSGEQVNINRLEYYLSMFTLVHDGGQETAIEGAYVLADAFVDAVHPLGDVSGVQNVEGLKFHVGIDPDNNHADPAAWPADHPLAPQVPSMHWGWASGYRFIAIEGSAGAGGVVVHEIHALGDDNHFAAEMDVLASIENGVLTLDVEADIFGFYDNLSVAGGLINHGENGEAVLVCHNLAERVFRLPGAAGVRAIEGPAFGFDLIPREGGAELVFSQPLAARAEVQLLDLLGRPVQELVIPAGAGRFTIVDVRPGAFLISVNSGVERTTRRWIQE